VHYNLQTRVDIKQNLYFNNYSPIVIRLKITAYPPHFDVIVSLSTLFVLSPAISCASVLIVREKDWQRAARESGEAKHQGACSKQCELSTLTQHLRAASTPRPHPHQLQAEHQNKHTDACDANREFHLLGHRDSTCLMSQCTLSSESFCSEVQPPPNCIILVIFLFTYEL
jgi:hypothetical protein